VPGFQSNGALTVKSLSGGAYSSTENPTGAVARANQSAVTQPPTVIIQATSSGFFNYGTDCYILYGPTGGNAIGIGKLPTPTSFTGFAAQYINGQAMVGAMYLLALATGGSNGSTPTFNGVASSFNSLSAGNNPIFIAQSMPIAFATKCYP
jgi:hypothetical protein